MKLNKGQTEAVYSNDSKILCLAGAGTGKTHCMIERISRLASIGVDPRSILSLTFTNAAAFEMRDRYRRRNPDVAIPEFRTFHSFCYSLLASNPTLRKRFGYSATPSIADAVMYKKIMKQAAMQVGIHMSEKKMSGKESLSVREQKDRDILIKSTERLMKQQNLITFDMLCRGICQLFIVNDEDIRQYKDRFKYIFVDEFQDTDINQWEFVKSFENSDLFIVGDALQALYSFRGADSSIIKSVAENNEWTKIRLTENYRSTKPICDYANKFTKGYAKSSYRIEIESGVPGDNVEVRYDEHSGYLQRGEIASHTVNVIIDDSKKLEGNVAILCRTNAEVSSVEDTLKLNNIPYSTGKKNEDAFHIMKSALDNSYMMDWLATYLNSERYSEYIRQIAIRRDKDSEYTLDEFIKDFGFAKLVKERADKIYTVRRICREKRPLVDRAKDILKVIGYSKLQIDEVKLLECRKASEFLSFLCNVIEEKVDGTSDIYVGTVHSVKGLEYDNVYVLGVHGRSFQLINEDNNNVFYVAVTRAKKHLVVYISDN